MKWTCPRNIKHAASNNSFTALDSNLEPDSATAERTRLDLFRFHYVGYVEMFFFPAQINSISHMKEKIGQAIEAVSTENLESEGKFKFQS